MADIPDILQQILDEEEKPSTGPDGEQFVPDPDTVRMMQELSVRNAHAQGIITAAQMKEILTEHVGVDPDDGEDDEAEGRPAKAPSKAEKVAVDVAGAVGKAQDHARFWGN